MQDSDMKFNSALHCYTWLSKKPKDVKSYQSTNNLKTSISAVPILLLVPITLVVGTPVTDGGSSPSMFLGGLENLDDPKLNVSPKQYQKWLKAYTKEYFR